MKRRDASLLTVGTALVAAVGGLGIGWRYNRMPQSPADDGIWSLQFDRPEGGKLALAPLQGQIVVVNFWATWCPPCVEELPEFDRLHRERSALGVQVVGLAVDTVDAVVRFLQIRPVGFPVGLVGFEGLGLARGLGNTGGAMPFTVLFDRAGGPLRRKLGRTNFEELATWIDEVLAPGR